MDAVTSRSVQQADFPKPMEVGVEGWAGSGPGCLAQALLLKGADTWDQVQTGREHHALSRFPPSNLVTVGSA